MGYNTIGKIGKSFVNSTSIPMVGAVVNCEIPNSVESALNSSATQLLAGDPVVLTLQNNAGKNLSMDRGFNYNNSIIKAKATTITGGAGATDLGGFIVMSSSDVSLAQGSIPVPQNGVLTQVVKLGGGAQLWLEVAQQNTAEFQTDTLDVNSKLTFDFTNGGVKLAQADAIAGMKLKSGLAKAQKIKEDNGAFVVVDCYAVLVELL